jgi:hypothetical protein
MKDNTPSSIPNSIRITLNLPFGSPRLDQPLLEALRGQSQNTQLRDISRSEFKILFKKGKIKIKGQNATPSSSLAPGVTYVDILL